MERDAVYFGRRANEERVAAMKAPDPRAQKAHRDMADRYNKLVNAVGSQEAKGGSGTQRRRIEAIC